MPHCKYMHETVLRVLNVTCTGQTETRNTVKSSSLFTVQKEIVTVDLRFEIFTTVTVQSVIVGCDTV
jgi:hypothetical protein